MLASIILLPQNDQFRLSTTRSSISCNTQDQKRLTPPAESQKAITTPLHHNLHPHTRRPLVVLNDTRSVHYPSSPKHWTRDRSHTPYHSLRNDNPTSDGDHRTLAFSFSPSHAPCLYFALARSHDVSWGFLHGWSPWTRTSFVWARLLCDDERRLSQICRSESLTQKCDNESPSQGCGGGGDWNNCGSLYPCHHNERRIQLLQLKRGRRHRLYLSRRCIDE